MKIPVEYVVFTTGIPPMVRGSSNIVTDKNCEIWWDTDLRLLFVRPRGVTTQGKPEPMRFVLADAAEMRPKFPEDFPGWEEERTAPVAKGQAQRKAS